MTDSYQTLRPNETAIPLRCAEERRRVGRVLRRWARSLESATLVLPTGEFAPVGPLAGDPR